MSDNAPIIVLFREDLRLGDNPALYHAAATGRPVLPLYIWDHHTARPDGAAKAWARHHSLAALDDALRQSYGIGLTLRQGRMADQLAALLAETGATAIYWNRRYGPKDRAEDARIKQALPVTSFNGALLFEPWELAPASAPFYKVFTPFWKVCRARLDSLPAPLPRPARITAPPHVASERLDAWGWLPTHPDWSTGFDWVMGESAAHDRLHYFLDRGLSGYKTERNRPDLDHTSRLSPYLALGNVSPRQVLATTMAARGGMGDGDVDHFLSEIGWREFSHNLLFHLDDLPGTLLREPFWHFPWRQDDAALKRWQQGQTGYPFVDAGLRQLWHTGWMHNRVRMVVASFLIKHLLIDWRQGEAWFWDTLIDADLANNCAGWQWVSGGGADAAPYFRIFNPITQGEKFDPDGAYTKAWVPELKDVPLSHLFQPWTLSPLMQQAAGVRIGQDYPEPIIDHASARNRALAAYEQVKSRQQ